MQAVHAVREPLVTLALTYENQMVAMMAPSLPMVAANPWYAARMSVGNISPAGGRQRGGRE